MLAAEAVGKTPGEIVRQRLGDAKYHDEGKNRRARHDVKFLLGNGGQNAALQARHRADKGVDEHQQRELAEVFTQPEADGRHVPALSAQTHIGPHHGFHIGWAGRNLPGQVFNEGGFVHCQRRVPALLETKGR